MMFLQKEIIWTLWTVKKGGIEGIPNWKAQGVVTQHLREGKKQKWFSSPLVRSHKYLQFVTTQISQRITTNILIEIINVYYQNFKIKVSLMTMTCNLC